MPEAPRPGNRSTLIRRTLMMLHWAQQRGWPWVFQRARNELTMPVSRPGRALRNALASIEGAMAAAAGTLFRWMPGVANDAKSTLFFFYDLQVCPIAYDIAYFLGAAELERRRRGLDHVHVVIVPGQTAGMRLERPDYDAVVDEHARRWRLHNLVIPAIGLLPTCTGYTLCSSREHGSALRLLYARHVFPRDWRPAFPVAPLARLVRDAASAGETVFPLLAAPVRALQYVDQFVSGHLGTGKLVVITLRQYAYTPARNSNIADWLAFADSLDAERYAVVFVLDTDAALGRVPAGIERYPICHAASWSLQVRMALYERAFLNLSVMHGPMELCCHNETCRYIVFYPMNTAPLTTTQNLIAEGFEVGKQLAFARPWQWWVWERDDLEVIRREFSSIVAILESSDDEACA